MDPRNEIQFWSRQLSEHALFFNLGLEVEPFKTQAGALHADWERARGALASASDLLAAQSIVTRPVANLSDFQKNVMATLQTQWLGWITPLFFDHTQRELEYFVARAWYGGWPAGTTLASNLRFMREHAEFAAHLLDPTQPGLIQQAQSAANAFASIEQNCCAALTPSILALSRQAGVGLDSYLRNNPVGSSTRGVIHPVLADHVWYVRASGFRTRHGNCLVR
jgi:hypothetical protein